MLANPHIARSMSQKAQEAAGNSKTARARHEISQPSAGTARCSVEGLPDGRCARSTWSLLRSSLQPRRCQSLGGLRGLRLSSDTEAYRAF